ncbi:MAG TPA: hypothetical protein VK831_04005, partial [Candidatus Deferrimicrobiaceae bacterium]|nr:hypothetical protein [Candidatus Deferrimicrobiaceae bacterium]
NIIFGTSFNDRLGDEVAITVIATGFDGRTTSASARAAAGAGSETSVRAPRDFLEELERQRGQLNEAGVPETPTTIEEPGADGGARSTAEPVPVKRAAYDADDLEIPSFLRRGR